MQCTGCHEFKLSNEFPRGRVTEHCRHRPWCLRCVTVSYIKDKSCPGCPHDIEKDQYESLCARLAVVAHEKLFEPLSVAELPSTSTPHQFNIFVTTLTGEYKEIIVRKEDVTANLRHAIKSAFGLDAEYQRLFFNGKELDLATKLTQYGIGPGSRVQVQQVLLALRGLTTLQHIEFVLQWGYTTKLPAYLNGSCLVFSGTEYWGAVNFQNPDVFQGIRHSGKAKIVYRQKLGRQGISVSLNDLHPNITDLYFVLSAFRVSSLTKFSNPTVQLYDSADPNTLLSNYEIASTGKSQAVVMCCLKKDPHRGWIVIAIGRRSAGNVWDYSKTLKTISTLWDS